MLRTLGIIGAAFVLLAVAGAGGILAIGGVDLLRDRVVVVPEELRPVILEAAARCRTRKQFTAGKRAPSAARPRAARALSHRAPTCPALRPLCPKLWSALGSEQLQDVQRVVGVLARAARGRRRRQAER